MESFEDQEKCSFKEPENSRFKAPDGGWGWIVVLASFLTHSIVEGCVHSYGVLNSEFLDVFGESKGKTAIIGSLLLSFGQLNGPVASILTDKYGCRFTTILGSVILSLGFFASAFAQSVNTLIFTIGVIGGIGLSFIYVPALVIVAFYFEKRRSLATAIAMSGAGIGTFIFAPLIDFFIQKYAWRGAMIMLSCLTLQIIILGSLFRPIKRKGNSLSSAMVISSASIRNYDPEMLTSSDNSYQSVENSFDTNEDEKNILMRTVMRVKKKVSMFFKTSNVSLIEYFPFLIFIFANMIIAMWYDIPYVYGPDMLIEMNYSKELSSFIISIMGIATIGQIFIGWVGDFEKMNSIYFFGLCTILAGIASALFGCFHDYFSISVMAAAFGLLSSANDALSTSIIASLCGIDHVTSAYGILSMFMGISNFFGPPIAGIVADRAKNYKATFVVCGASICVAGIILLLIPLIQKRTVRNNQLVKTSFKTDNMEIIS